MDLKIVWLSIFLIFSNYLFSQDRPVKTIKAFSEKVDIRVGTDYYAKGGWHLEPAKKPDVFRIGSKWNYETLKVSFTTDLDSISFDVKPNSQYDFIILLEDKTPCHIQILTAPNPVFMDWKIILILGIFFTMTSILFVRIHSLKKIRRFLLFGIISPLLFWCLVFIASSIQGDYDHFRNVISELGTVGTKAEIFTSSSLIIIAFSSLVFSIGFLKSSQILKISKFPALCTFVMPVSSLWAAIFPLGNEFHGLLGPSPLIFMVGVWSSIFLWKNHNYLDLRRYSYLSLFLLLMIGLRFLGTFGQMYEGLVQRFFYVGWSVWLFAIAINFRKKMLKSHKVSPS